jgi:hypothetical protein
LNDLFDGLDQPQVNFAVRPFKLVGRAIEMPPVMLKTLPELLLGLNDADFGNFPQPND